MLCQFVRDLVALKDMLEGPDSEAELLRVLTQNIGRAVDRAELNILADDVNPRTVDVQITRLRRKIEPDPRQPRYLQTVRGTGYLLRADP